MFLYSPGGVEWHHTWEGRGGRSREKRDLRGKGWVWEDMIILRQKTSKEAGGGAVTYKLCLNSLCICRKVFWIMMTLSWMCPADPTVSLNHNLYSNSCALTVRINTDGFCNMQCLPYVKTSDLISDLLLITHTHSGITMPCCEVASLSLCSHWALSWLNLSSSSSFSLPQFLSPICSWDDR